MADVIFHNQSSHPRTHRTLQSQINPFAGVATRRELRRELLAYYRLSVRTIQRIAHGCVRATGTCKEETECVSKLEFALHNVTKKDTRLRAVHVVG
jgi:hypothetical protein